MAEIEKAQAATLPRIGDLIDSATGVKYESYSADQKLGRPGAKELEKNPDDARQYKGIEAAEAFMINNPEVQKEKIYALLEKQGDERRAAVQKDMPKVLDGEKLGGLKPVAMVNGKVAMGQLVMTDAPTRNDVTIEADKAKVDKVSEIRNDNHWKIAEAISNASNAVRDAEVNLDNRHMTDGHLDALTESQKKTVLKGLNAEDQIQSALEAGKAIRKHGLFFMNSEDKLVHRMDKTMDVAAQAAGIKLDDPAYKHYRQEMDKNIHAGLEAGRDEAAKQLRAAGVTPANSDSGPATHASVAAPSTERSK